MVISSPNSEHQTTLLFVGEEVTLSHIVRLIALATPLAKNPRFQIIFACGSRYRTLVEQTGLKWHPHTTIPAATFARRLKLAISPLYRYDELLRYTEDDITLLQTIQPAIVISDFRLSLDIAARHTGIPHINLADGFWSPASTLPYPQPENTLSSLVSPRIAQFFFPFVLPLILSLYLKPLIRLYHHYKLRPPISQRDAWTRGSLVLYPDLPSLTPVSHLPDHHRFIGPIFWEPDLPLPAWLNNSDPTHPLIYISFGSSGNIDLFPLLFQILGSQPVRVIVSTAGRDLPGTPPQNFFLTPYVSARAIIQQAKLVICHGGNTVVYQALRHGVPVLGIPENITQYFCMHQIDALHAGILLRPGQTNHKTLTQALDTLLHKPLYTNQAIRLQQELNTYDTHALFLSALEELLEKTGR